MYYESYSKKPTRKQRRQRKRRGCLGVLAHFFLKLLALVLIVALLVCGLLYILPTSAIVIEPKAGNLSPTTELPGTPYNVLLLGVDILNSGSQRSDSIIIASVDNHTVKLTSVLRDTVVDIPGYGSGKINGAYAHGGAELTMRTLNENFKLNLVKYVVVDFTALVKLVDAIGGIDIDISKEEMDHINTNVVKSGKVFVPLGYTYDGLLTYGDNTHLNGLMALGYARIRKLDSDFKRASRQRIVLNAMLKKIKSNLWNPALLTRLATTLPDCINTNLNLAELLSLGEKAVISGSVQQLRLPVDGSYSDNGSSLKITDMGKNITAFRSFVY